MWCTRMVLLCVLLFCPSIAGAQRVEDQVSNGAHSVVRIVAEGQAWIPLFSREVKHSTGFVLRRIARANGMYGYVIVASRHGVVTEKGEPMRVRVTITNKPEIQARLLAYGCRVRDQVTAVSVRVIDQKHPLCVADVSLLYVEMQRRLPVVRIGHTPVRHGSFCAFGYAVENKERISHQCSRMGKILKADEWFYNALGIGIARDISQGMSGGPIVDGAQSVIGITVFGRTEVECAAFCPTVARTVYPPHRQNNQMLEYIRKWSWGVPIQVVCTMYGVCEKPVSSNR